MNNSQMIISVGREYGSAGREIAIRVAQNFNIPWYDSNLLNEIAELKSINPDLLKKYDEVPKNKWFSRKVNGYSNSPEENIANIQFEYMKKMASEGKSFVIVGRCADSVLKEFDSLTTVFITGDMDKKIERIMRISNLNKQDALKKILKRDKKRKAYHNYYCDAKWGDSRNYELCINSSRIGIDKTVELVCEYIKRKYEMGC